MNTKIISPFIVIAFMLLALEINAQMLDQQIDRLIEKMTLEEKVKQLHQEGSMNTASNSRLNIPGFTMADGPHGVRNGLATSFPVGIGMAATWDIDLAYRVGAAMGKEFRGKGICQALGPCLDLTLDPRNGRSPESTSEDPVLNARINTAFVQGIQSTPALATVKHFYTEYRQNGRTTNNYLLSQRNLLEQHGLQFREAVQMGGAFCVMNSYNLLNGKSASKNSDLLTTVLREKWGFPFYVVSDWGSIYNNPGEAVLAGCDIEMGSTLFQDATSGLLNLVKTGNLAETTIDAAVKNVLRTKYLAGMLHYYPQGDPADVNCTAHQELALEAGKKSLVLLKNQDNILPININSITKIAVIGPNAAVMQTDASGSSWVDPFYKVSPKEGIENYVGTEKVLYAQGCQISGNYAGDLNNALAYAGQAEVVIFFGGLDPTQEGEGFDRANNSIELPGKQKDLIRMLSGTNKNLIVVLVSGGICTVAPFINEIKGLIYAFYPGQEGGNAIAQVLFGDYNPGGKLPVTMPKTDAQMPNRFSNKLDDISGGGYRWYDSKNVVPQFAFGFGLSFTSFRLDNFQMSPRNSAYWDQPILISLDVTNTGAVAGEEVVQLYLSITSGAVSHAKKDLKDFRKIFLQPNQTKTVTFQITPDMLYYFSEPNNCYDIDPGTYTFYVGNSSDSLQFSQALSIVKRSPQPDLQLANLYAVPRYPLKGDSVFFLATILNRGTGASPSNTVHAISFRLNGIRVSRSVEFSGSIPAGGMVLVGGNIGEDDQNYWIADNPGTYSLEAILDDQALIPEINEMNNSKIVPLKVLDAPPKNLARNKTVTVSSIESAVYTGQNAVDGDYSTRWSSQFSDFQTFKIDLGEVQHFNQIQIYWETAYGKEYTIQVSENGINWTKIVDQKNGLGGVEKWVVDANARFLLLIGSKRGTSWGYSIYEFEIFDQVSTFIDDSSIESPFDFLLSQNYPNPFNPVTIIKYALPARTLVTLVIFDITGRKIKTLVSGEQSKGNFEVVWDGRDESGNSVSSGVYFYRITTEKFKAVKKMTLIR